MATPLKPKFHSVLRKNPGDKDAPGYFYPQPITLATISLLQMAELINKKCTVTIHDCKAVLSALEDEFCTAIKQGLSVHMGDMGMFRTTIRGERSDTAKDVRKSKIKSVHVVYTPTTTMKTMLKTMDWMKEGEAEEKEEDEKTPAV